MAYVTPTSRDPGTIITSAIWTQDVVNNVIYLKGAAGTISFDAGATFSGVVTATAGVVATTLSTSGLIKAGGGIVSETNISAFGILNVAGDAAKVRIDTRSGTTSYLHFRVLGSTNSQIAVTAADTLFDYGGTNNRLAFRKGLDGPEQIVFTNSGCITVLSGMTVDGVDVSAIHKYGTYTGTSGTRQITVGFAPKWVDLIPAGAPDPVGGGSKYTIYRTSSALSCAYAHNTANSSGYEYLAENLMRLDTSDGFWTEHGYGNCSNKIYFYMAYGQGTP